MGRISDRLAALGVELPALFAPPPPLSAFKFERVRVAGRTAYVSGHGPLDGHEVLVSGKVGGDVSPEQGYEAARLTALSVLASLHDELGDLDRVTGWVKLLGLVNGFSDLVLELWGEAGRHARSAIGAAELPFDMSVEVEAIVEVS